MKQLFTIALLITISIALNAQEDRTYGDITEALKNPERVYKLDLGFDKLGRLPDSIKLLTNLTYLKVSSNKLTEFSEAITELTNLTELDICFNELTSLPASIGKLTKLSKLNISANKITALPESIGKLTNLTTLNVSFNELTSLPESIGKLSNLTEFKISSNKLSTLPESIGKLNKLARLNLGFNDFDSLPESIISMTNLANIEAIKELKNEIIREKKKKVERDAREKKRLEEISHFEYVLNFDPNSFANPETGEFDGETAYKSLPWEIEDIYDYLKTKKDFIYSAEKYSYKKNKVVAKAIVGFKIEINENEEIESLTYNYSEKEYLKRGGLFEELKTVITKDSTNNNMKFMPFVALMTFRVLDETETIKINKKEYECTQVEGVFMFEKIKYWMVTNKSGLIVKIVNESTYNRETWLLKKIK